jgi:N-acetyl-alpha-D-muramate 1-phosphate uridylyltransferase
VKAMIFAAGLGTRLRPLTHNIPKALVRINNTPLIELIIKKLIDAGFLEIVINLHHFPDKIESFFKSKNNFGVQIKFSYENLLLDTGGGLLHAAHFFDDGKPFLLHNTDVISSIDFIKMMDFHQQKKPLVTLFVQNRISSRYLLFDKSGKLAGWKNDTTGEKIIVTQNNQELTQLGFNGIHIVDPHIFDLIDKTGSFPIMPEYLRLANDHAIIAFQDDVAKYIDVGKPKNIHLAENLFA